MRREEEVAEYLRGDPLLGTLLPGGIYADADLGDEGITDAVTTPDVWSGGTLRATAIVRERAEVPTLQLVDVKRQVADSNQVVEIWLYAPSAAALDSVRQRVYALMQGHVFARAWPAVWVPGLAVGSVPELPAGLGIKMMREDYQIRALRRAA
jgi:hypothetical protein